METNQQFLNNKNAYDEFRLLGYFSTSPKTEDILKGSTGILTFKNGEANIELMPSLRKKTDGGIETLIRDNKDDLLYGLLENGVYIKLEQFQYKKEHIAIDPLSVTYYISYITDFSKEAFTNKDFKCVNALIEFEFLDRLSISLFDAPLNMLKNGGEPVNIGIFNGVRYTLQYFVDEEKNRLNVSISSKIKLSMESIDKKPIENIEERINQFRSFLSVLCNTNVQILSRRYFNEDYDFLRLNSVRTKSASFIPTGVVTFDFYRFKSDFQEILEKIGDCEEKLQHLLQSFVSNIDDHLDISNSFTHYVNAVDLYMNGSTYSDGKKISQLKNKIKFWINSFPEDIRNYFLKDSDEEKLDNYIHHLVDTRDYLTHGDKRTSSFLLHEDVERVEYISFFKLLIHAYLLWKYSIPNELIIRYFDMFYYGMNISKFNR